ncbi:MAG: hypothetical protein JKY37_08450 [Nannocystaceae bacterium]|nr:hypothetical protein [Nannocystaceae bacterium]
MQRAAIGLAGALVVATACGSDDSASQDGTDGTIGTSADSGSEATSASTDTGRSNPTSESSGSAPDTTDADTAEDTGTTTGGQFTCRAPLLDETFEIDPVGTDGQIHPAVFFDAELQGVWVAYNAPSADGSSKFDVFVARVGCDSNAQIEPTLVNQTTGQNDIDPDLARGDGNLLVTWASDNGAGGSDNLAVLVQSLGLDGQPTLTQDVALATTFDGEAFSGSAWMSRIAAVGAGEFAIIGTRAIESVSAFQVFVQRVDDQAQSLGDTAAFAPIPNFAHDTPHLAVEPSGDVVAAWVRTEDFELRQVETTRVVGSAFEDADPTLLTETHATGPALVSGPQGTLLAVSEAQGANARIRLSRLGPAAEPVFVGDDGGLHHAPAIVAMPGGAALLWYRHLGGLSNELLTARVSDDGEALSVSAPVVVPDAVAPPYATTLTHVADDIIFIAWAQGQSPNFRIYGRFVRVGE